jgi:hypothetical protein
MVVNRTLSPIGRFEVSVSPPAKRLSPRRLEKENEILRRKVHELELEKSLGDEIALQMFQAGDAPLLPPVKTGAMTAKNAPSAAAHEIKNPPPAGLQQRASWEGVKLLDTRKSVSGGGSRGVILDESSSVMFLDLKHAGPIKKVFKSEAKTASLYKSAALAAERARAHVQGAHPMADGGRKQDEDFSNYRIRFAHHDKTALLQQRAHETFKSLAGGSNSASAAIRSQSFMGGARTDLMSTAARTPRSRLVATETHGRDPLVHTYD